MTSLRKIATAIDLIPTTRIRLLVTIGLIAATGITYLMHACDYRSAATQACVGWEPSVNWFIFLSALAGVDVTQYFAKSLTAVKQAQVAAQAVQPTAEVSGDVTATSDVSEINTQQEKG